MYKMFGPDFPRDGLGGGCGAKSLQYITTVHDITVSDYHEMGAGFVSSV